MLPLILASSLACSLPAHTTQAPETLDESVPVALVSQDALNHHTLARTLFNALPTEQKIRIAQTNAIGPDRTPYPGLGVLSLDQPHRTPMTIAQAEAAFGLRFSPTHRSMLERFTEQAEAGNPAPALCLHPDTEPKLAEALLSVIDGLMASDAERYQNSSRWTTTATDGGGIPIRTPITVTWSYVPDGSPTTEGANSNLFSWLDGVYASNGGRTEWQFRISSTFLRWGFLCGITYVEVSDDGATVNSSNVGALGSRGDVRISGIPIDGNGSVLAYNYYPNRGDMFIDNIDNFYNPMSQNSRALRNVVWHEHGHGMGLAHVEPVDQTKLMEPNISLSYNGPRTDDTLGAQRNYGDAFEDNETLATAYNIGAFSDADSYLRRDLSTDDNSDIDYYEFSVDAQGDVTVTLEIAAGEYLMGPQNGTPVLTDYGSIHDLQFQIRDNLDNVIATVNSTGLGADESGTVAVPSAGTYHIRVEPTNATNNIQLYDMRLAFAETSNPCPPDVNGDGILDNGDIIEFINLFLASDLAADMNADGILDNGDIIEFINLFLAGCN